MEPYGNCMYYGPQRGSARYEHLEPMEEYAFEKVHEELTEPYEGIFTTFSVWNAMK